MSKKWIAINLLLLAVAGALARQLYISVLRFNAENDLAKIQPVRDMKQKMTQEKPLPKMAPAKKYAAADFAVIPEKNIFAESRSKEDKVEETAPPEPPPLTQKPILVGITISGTQRMAAIIDPAGSPQNQNRRAQNKRIGDVYHGYTITDITSDRIVLESGTRKEIIPLHEGSKRSRGGKTSVVATRVVSIGTGGGGGSIPVYVVSETAGTTKPTAVPGVPPAPPGAGQQAGRLPAGTTARPAAAVAPQQPATPAQQRPAQTPGTEGTDTPRGRVIRTPFGNIVRPDRN
jgi:hypothetical protein